MGMIELNLHTNLPIGSPIIGVLLGKRWKEYKDQLISGVVTNLTYGPIWLQSNPSCMMALNDKYLKILLRTNSLKTNRMNLKAKGRAIKRPRGAMCWPKGLYS